MGSEKLDFGFNMVVTEPNRTWRWLTSFQSLPRPAVLNHRQFWQGTKTISGEILDRGHLEISGKFDTVTTREMLLESSCQRTRMLPEHHIMRRAAPNSKELPGLKCHSARLGNPWSSHLMLSLTEPKMSRVNPHSCLAQEVCLKTAAFCLNT